MVILAMHVRWAAKEKEGPKRQSRHALDTSTVQLLEGYLNYD